MKPSPVLAGMGAYPFTRLAEEKRRLLAAGVDLVDFGVGEPREETPRFIRDALAAGVPRLSTYPLAEGLPETRAAIAGWVERRFGAALDPDHEVVPTMGSKEAIFHLPQLAGGDLVAVTTPAYPSRRAARRSPAAGCSSSRCTRRPASCPTSTRSTRPRGTASACCS